MQAQNISHATMRKTRERWCRHIYWAPMLKDMRRDMRRHDVSLRHTPRRRTDYIFSRRTPLLFLRHAYFTDVMTRRRWLRLRRCPSTTPVYHAPPHEDAHAESPPRFDAMPTPRWAFYEPPMIRARCLLTVILFMRWCRCRRRFVWAILYAIRRFIRATICAATAPRPPVTMPMIFAIRHAAMPRSATPLIVVIHEEFVLLKTHEPFFLSTNGFATVYDIIYAVIYYYPRHARHNTPATIITSRRHHETRTRYLFYI